jgi:hypothetical protein
VHYSGILTQCIVECYTCARASLIGRMVHCTARCIRPHRHGNPCDQNCHPHTAQNCHNVTEIVTPFHKVRGGMADTRGLEAGMVFATI